ncbi:hypothetical protein [Lacibacter sp. H407]|uniref:hypothetical protein n=1 Tax=Lacibacter sp. H407 TaxID=3133423 RepID=UPI0030BFC972
MFNCKLLLNSLILLLGTACLTGCGLIFGLIYKDWRSEVAYKSSTSKKDYFIIEGITQSHCGCSDVVVKNYVNKKLDFTFYYGGGLFPAKKNIYRFNANKNKIDTLIYIPVTSDNYTVEFDSLDKEILRRIDTLVTNRPRGSGLIYKVNQHYYKGFISQK